MIEGFDSKFAKSFGLFEYGMASEIKVEESIGTTGFEDFVGISHQVFISHRGDRCCWHIGEGWKLHDCPSMGSGVFECNVESISILRPMYYGNGYLLGV